MIDPDELSSSTLDLSNLREVFGDDKDGARMLVDTLITSTEESLSVLRGQCTDGGNEIWKKAAHAMKGEMANLGAYKLSDLCKDAQHGFEASAQEKKAFLEAIEREWAAVQTALSQML